MSQATPQSTVHDYWMLVKPSVMSLAIFTALCGFLLAPGHMHPLLATISLLSIAVGAGGAGVLNMWYERSTDALMARTQKRPTVKQSISPGNALAFGLLLSGGSVIFLGFAANMGAALLLAFTIFFYSVIYTIWLKPRTPQNIVIGGIAGAFPPIIGWWLLSLEFSWFPTLMFFIIFFWTPVHFWALALYRSDDYARAKIPILPTMVGRKRTCEQIFLYAILTVLTSCMIYFMEYLSLLFFLGALGLGGYLILLSKRVWQDDMRKAQQLFRYSIIYLFALFLLMVIDHYLVG